MVCTTFTGIVLSCQGWTIYSSFNSWRPYIFRYRCYMEWCSWRYEWCKRVGKDILDKCSVGSTVSLYIFFIAYTMWFDARTWQAFAFVFSYWIIGLSAEDISFYLFDVSLGSWALLPPWGSIKGGHGWHWYVTFWRKPCDLYLCSSLLP